MLHLVTEVGSLFSHVIDAEIFSLRLYQDSGLCKLHNIVYVSFESWQSLSIAETVCFEGTPNDTVVPQISCGLDISEPAGCAFPTNNNPHTIMISHILSIPYHDVHILHPTKNPPWPPSYHPCSSYPISPATMTSSASPTTPTWWRALSYPTPHSSLPAAAPAPSSSALQPTENTKRSSCKSTQSTSTPTPINPPTKSRDTLSGSRMGSGVSGEWISLISWRARLEI